MGLAGFREGCGGGSLAGYGGCMMVVSGDNFVRSKFISRCF